jgi:hypothetical protein
VSQRYKNLVAGGPYATIDELMGRVAQCDIRTLDILDSMIGAHYGLWSVAGDVGANQDMTIHAIRLEKLLRLRAEINRELAPGQHLHQTLASITINGQAVAVDADTIHSAREKIGTELAKISERLEAGRRAAEQRLIEGARRGQVTKGSILRRRRQRTRSPPQRFQRRQRDDARQNCHLDAGARQG